MGQNARKGKHERQRSKDHNRRSSYDRKAYSAEPQTAAAIMGKRWEDLIDAAASATEEDSRDLTPVSFPTPRSSQTNYDRSRSLRNTHPTSTIGPPCPPSLLHSSSRTQPHLCKTPLPRPRLNWVTCNHFLRLNPPLSPLSLATTSICLPRVSRTRRRHIHIPSRSIVPLVGSCPFCEIAMHALNVSVAYVKNV